MLYVDNDSVATKLPQFLRNTRPCRHYPNDIDIISHALFLWRQLDRFNLTLEWVKAHQDDTVPVPSLPLKAKLNILADKLASDYTAHIRNPGKQPRSNPMFFPTAKVSLLVNGQRVTSKYMASTRFHMNGTGHCLYLQKRNQ